MGFIIDLIKQKRDIERQGGMLVKYKELLNYLMSSAPNVKIYQSDSSSVLIGQAVSSGSTTLFLVQTFGYLTIEYKVKSIVYGNHSMEMKFPENMPQSQMIEQIEKQVAEFNLHVLRKYMDY